MKDKCNCCGVETLYDKETHIDFRIGYVDTAGQLCLDCFKVIYYPKKNLTQGDTKNGLGNNHIKTTSTL